MGACGAVKGTAVPVSLVAAKSAADRFASNCDADKPVASTVNVFPFSSDTPSVELRPETTTLMPGVKLFTAWNVTMLPVIENDVSVATVLQLAELQAPNGATISATSESGALLPVEIVFVLVRMAAIVPASQIATYTWLLSAAAVVNILNRVEPGV